MSLLIQISDTHFGTEQPAVLAALCRLTQRLRPDIAVLSGDITQRARGSQFAAARRFTDRLGVPQLLVIPGNHDIPLFDVVARLLFPYRNYMRAFGTDLEPQLDCEGFLVLALNTTRAARHKDGEVSSTQIERVAAQLQRARPEQLRVVVTHQPVHVIRQVDLKNLLHGHEAAVRTWAAAGVDLIMGGHIHLPYVQPIRQVLPDLPRDVWAVQAGTAVSSRTRDGIPNSINVVRHVSGAGACTVERWDFAAGEFARVASDQLPLDRAACCAEQ
jgi:3',5'-cyclic AMP phosphodiesterase CpdA